MARLIQDHLHPIDDVLYQKMEAAFHGGTERWTAVTRSLRDALIDYAVASCPYYRRAIRPGSRFEDIPVLTKALIREHLEDLLARGVPEERRHPERTSGSSGAPLSFYRDRSQALIENTSSERFLRRLHGIPYDATMVAITATPQRLAREPSGLLGRLPWRRPDPWIHPVTTVGLTADQLAEELAVWSRFSSYFILGYASSVDWIAGVIAERELRIDRPPAAVATTSEVLTEDAQARIEKAFGATVHQRYGSLELPYLAATLPGTRTFACNPLLGYVEVVDEAGRAAGPGSSGRVLVTDLNNYVMPLIRYELGDVATESAEGYVGGFRLLDEVLGRSSEVLRLPSGGVIGGTQLGQVLFKAHDFTPLIRLYQCLQTSPNKLELRVVWHRAPSHAERDEVRNAIVGVLDPGMRVDLRDVEELERLPSGKIWIVRCLFD